MTDSDPDVLRLREQEVELVMKETSPSKLGHATGIR